MDGVINHLSLIINKPRIACQRYPLLNTTLSYATAKREKWQNVILRPKITWQRSCL